MPLLSPALSFHNRPKGFVPMMYEPAYGEKPFFPLVTPKCAAKFHNNSFPNIIIAPLVFVTVDSMLFLRSMVCDMINISYMKKNGKYIF